MSLSAEEVAKVTSLRLTPCWWTFGLLAPTWITIGVIGSQEINESGDPLFRHPLLIGLNGACLIGLAFSLVYWLDEWAEFNRRPRAWMVQRFPDAWPLFPASSPEWIDHHRNLVRIVGFGVGWIGAACVLGAVLKAAGIAK